MNELYCERMSSIPYNIVKQGSPLEHNLKNIIEKNPSVKLSSEKIKDFSDSILKDRRVLIPIVVKIVIAVILVQIFIPMFISLFVSFNLPFSLLTAAIGVTIALLVFDCISKVNSNKRSNFRMSEARFYILTVTGYARVPAVGDDSDDFYYNLGGIYIDCDFGLKEKKLNDKVLLGIIPDNDGVERIFFRHFTKEDYIAFGFMDKSGHYI